MRGPIDQIAQKHGFTPFRVRVGGKIPQIGCAGFFDNLIAQLLQQLFQFVAASVNVADDVKRAAVAFAIVPQRLSLDFHRVDFFWGTQDVNVAKSFAI